MPAKFDDKSLIWVASEEPIKDSSFLTSRILNLCGHLPIFWLRPTYLDGTSAPLQELALDSGTVLHGNPVTSGKSNMPVHDFDQLHEASHFQSSLDYCSLLFIARLLVILNPILHSELHLDSLAPSYAFPNSCLVFQLRVSNSDCDVNVHLSCVVILKWMPWEFAQQESHSAKTKCTVFESDCKYIVFAWPRLEC